MVVFTCNHCGDSLQKPKVEKHYMVACRTVKSLTCVDCFKDFSGQDYEVHNKCVTEEERYAAKGSLPNGVIKKGEAKQESWTEMIKSILDNDVDLPPPHRNLLNTISTYSNVPRKKAKFLNFIKSSSGGRANMRDVEAVWDIIEKHKIVQIEAKKKEESMTSESNGKVEGALNEVVEQVKPKKSKKKQNEVKEVEADTSEDKEEANVDETNQSDLKAEKSKKNKKRKAEDMASEVEQQNNVVNEEVKQVKSKKNKKKQIGNEEEVEEGNSEDQQQESVAVESSQSDLKAEKTKKRKSEDAALAVEEKKVKVDEEPINFSFEETILEYLQKKNSMKLSKLQKKVINAYVKSKGLEESTPEHIKKFNKKLKKMEKLEICGEENIVKLLVG